MYNHIIQKQTVCKKRNNPTIKIPHSRKDVINHELTAIRPVGGRVVTSSYL